ncbi:MAG TPA: translation initiation factor IF-2 subunit beta [Methanocorpusculum sp.]|nr:translation initiation factor IF-2 subunit beta [Methanocorpusculum sp.]HJJ39677.1 translation initiation factor IF-2 subunit beta [Methanocorpusculum sp.]HJJ49286.1 translation initiation factor IF-2 subunit beta [Methanocorpusculum sp.]HJJ56670.1 translation initiation factor IF-2 subunit beta [Methanocorpusculum sp.]
MADSYEEMLQKAYAGIDEPTDTGERFVMPKTRVYLEGKTTVLENFADIADTLNREQDHFMKYILGELGTAGKIDGARAVFNGKFELVQFETIVKNYVSDYVICSECGRPDTILVMDKHILMLQCEACGAKRPIRKRKGKTETVAVNTVEEGREMEVTIESISKKGDGVARVGKYIVYVSGTKVGQKVKVRITKISGQVAFTQKTL